MQKGRAKRPLDPALCLEEMNHKYIDRFNTQREETNHAKNQQSYQGSPPKELE